MNTQQILEYITSRDSHKVWEASCAIIHISQDKDQILPLVPHLATIKQKTKDLNMGGGFAPNQRFITQAISAIEFHMKSKKCSCCLYLENAANPNKELDFITIQETVRIENKWVDYYLVICKKCRQKYKVLEREGHFMWWDWKAI